MDDSYRTLFSAFTCEFHFLNKSFKNRLFELKRRRNFFIHERLPHAEISLAGWSCSRSCTVLDYCIPLYLNRSLHHPKAQCQRRFHIGSHDVREMDLATRATISPPANSSPSAAMPATTKSMRIFPSPTAQVDPPPRKRAQQSTSGVRSISKRRTTVKKSRKPTTSLWWTLQWNLVKLLLLLKLLLVFFFWQCLIRITPMERRVSFRFGGGV